MNKWKIDNNMYLVQRDDITPSVKNTLVHRYIGTMDICTGVITTHDFLIEEKLFDILYSKGYWHTFCKKLCNDRERVLYDTDFPKEDLTLPILELRIEITVGV